MANLDTSTPSRSHLIWVVLVWAILFALRLLGPEDLLDKDQERPAAYVQDAVINGHWIIQTDLSGEVSSKPPLYTWLSALTTLAAGRISPLTLYLAPALATLGIALLLLWIARPLWGSRVSLACALVYLVSAVAAKQMALARTDGVFAFTVTLTALLAYRSWTTGKGWTWFWVAAALATLAKGPAGLVFGAGGLVAHFWEGRRTPRLRFRGSHLAGIVLYVVITGGWFYAAYLDLGQPVIDKMIHRELLGHATGSETDRMPGSLFYKPPLLFLARFAPWSLVAFVAFWRMWKYPSEDADRRRFERFLFCWFWVGLGVLALGAHQRGDLLNPMIPAAALLAGREAIRWLAEYPPARFNLVLAELVALGITLIGAKYYLLRPLDPYVKQTAEVKAVAQAVEGQVGAQFPFAHLSTPYGLQIYFDTLHREASTERIARLLQGEAAAYAWVSDTTDLSVLTEGPTPVHVLMETPLTQRAGLRLLSNRENLDWDDDIAACLGPLDVRMTGVRPIRISDQCLSFEPEGDASSSTVQITNASDSLRRVKLRLGRQNPWQRRDLEPGEVWRVVARP
jgi:4-amino-4-deoxy-L-arabinose transferase-like glycosyltransferase